MGRTSWIVRAALLAAVAATAPACVFAVGTKTGASDEDRLARLERRISAAEQRLGIPAPEPTTPAQPAEGAK